MKVAFILEPSVRQDKLQQFIIECCDYPCSFFDVSANYLELLDIQADLLMISAETTLVSIPKLLEDLKQIDFNLVIIASSQKYAIKAFHYGAIHYILTPITIKDILRLKQRMYQKMTAIV